MADYLSFDDVLNELMVDDEELKKLVSQGELRGFRDGMSMKFKREDVMNLRRGRDTEPTIILTDSDQEMGINESSDELILDESTSDTVLNIGDIMSPEKQEEEIVFSDSTEEFSISPHDSDPEAAIPTVEVPAIDEDLGILESESDSALIASQSATELAGVTTEARPIRMDSADETFELLDSDMPASEEDFIEVLDESGEDLLMDDLDVDVAPRKTTSGRVSRSARLRAMQMKQRPSEFVWTVVSMLSLVILVLPGSILVNRVFDTAPQWVLDFAGKIRETVGTVFESML
ncbi:MAG: MerR family transcriptional regulator [Planctomycetota bacterium]|jgi:hypothetical protein